MDNKTIARKVIDLISNGQLDALDRYVSPRWVHHDPQVPDTGRGPAGYKAGIEYYATAFPDMKLTIEAQIAEGDLVCTLWRGAGTNTGRFMDMNPTNRRFEIQGTTIDRFEGGKIVETWDTYDALGLLQQLGFVPKTSGGPQAGAERPQPRAK